MVDPKIMCVKHLNGEHLECHMFVSSILKKKKLNGFLTNNELEPLSIVTRHDDLAAEMIRRGINHKTPLVLSQTDLENSFTMEQINVRIDKDKSKNLLLSRCSKCGSMSSL